MKKNKIPPERLYDVCIIGGAGHVGFPLGLALAEAGKRVVLYDTNTTNLTLIKQGRVPFLEEGAGLILKKVIGKKLFTSSDIKNISTAPLVVVAVGTPVDNYLNPQLRLFMELFTDLSKYLKTTQTIIIRSTVYPQTCQQIYTLLRKKTKSRWHIAYCPERIIQGQALIEFKKLPQLVSGLTPKAIRDAKKLFSLISPQITNVSINEAELAKLFSNAWRYIQFAVANQFYMIAEEFGVDFNHVKEIMVKGYRRASSLPTPGFAAGPCLLKDTLQLAAFNKNKFLLGHAAMMVNEGLPGFIVDQLRTKFDLSKISVGILGMAYKANSDDNRDALSYKLGKILRFYGAKVLYSDEYVKNPTFTTKKKLIETSTVVIIGVPHSAYKQVLIPKNVFVVDPWGIVNIPKPI